MDNAKNNEMVGDIANLEVRKSIFLAAGWRLKRARKDMWMITYKGKPAAVAGTVEEAVCYCKGRGFSW